MDGRSNLHARSFFGVATVKMRQDEDLFKLPQPPTTGLLLICMIKKHTSIFRALRGNQGVAATPPLQKDTKKGLKSTLRNFYLDRGGGGYPLVTLQCPEN